MVSKESSINDIVDSLGIVRTGDRQTGVFWEYGGKRIPRPVFSSCWKTVYTEFGIDCGFLKFKGYRE